MITTYKICSRCELSLPLTDFYNNSAYLKYGARDGKQPYCKQCDNAKRTMRYEAHRDQELNRAAEYRESFPGKVRQSLYAWRNKNRQAYNTYMRQSNRAAYNARRSHRNDSKTQ